MGHGSHLALTETGNPRNGLDGIQIPVPTQKHIPFCLRQGRKERIENPCQFLFRQLGFHIVRVLAFFQFIQCENDFSAAPLLSASLTLAVNGNMPGHFGKKSVQKVGTPGWNRIPRRQICIADAFLRIFPVRENVVGNAVAVPAVFFVRFFNGLLRPHEEQSNDALILQGITSSCLSIL